MGQSECLEYLEKRKGKWIKTKIIANVLKQSKTVVSISLSKLFKYNEVKRQMRAHKEGYEWQTI